jgi:hypothetical protein
MKREDQRKQMGKRVYGRETCACTRFCGGRRKEWSTTQKSDFREFTRKSDFSSIVSILETRSMETLLGRKIRTTAYLRLSQKYLCRYLILDGAQA